jgi:hypothetical protein
LDNFTGRRGWQLIFLVQRHTPFVKGSILIEYLVHLFVHVLVFFGVKFVFFPGCLGFKKEEGEEKQTPEIYH